jgi:hypothetical protein
LDVGKDRGTRRLRESKPERSEGDTRRLKEPARASRGN